MNRMSRTRRIAFLLVAGVTLAMSAIHWRSSAGQGGRPAPATPGAAPTLADIDGPPEVASSTSLIEDSRAWDGHGAAFTGEAIGESMSRGSMSWIHLNDDAYVEKSIREGAVLGGTNSGMAVWTPSGMARRIRHFGGYGCQGDIVKVTGVFHAACREHGGDMDIHASRLEIVRPGRRIREPFHAGRLIACFGAILLTGLLFLSGRATRSRSTGPLTLAPGPRK